MVASLGIGMHALSSVISTKTPPRPSASTTSTAKFTIGSVIEARIKAGLGERAGPVPLFATTLDRYHERLAARHAEVTASGRYILGPEVTAFEDEFAAYCGARHCVG